MAAKYTTFINFLWGVLLIFQTVLTSTGQSTPHFPNIRFLAEPEDIIAIPTQRAVLNCQVSVSGDYTPRIKWLRDSVVLNLNTDSARSLAGNGSLIFNPVIHTPSNKLHEGSYQCLVEVRGIGSVRSRLAKLQIAHMKPFFEEDPRDLSVRVGDTAMFGCMIESVPSPTIRWYHGSELVDENSENVLYHRDGVLELIKVSTSDFGSYKCCASLRSVRTESTCSSTATLRRDDSRFSGAPVFVMRPVDSRVLVGEEVTLYCAANGGEGSAEAEITWLKDGVTLVTGIFERHTITGEGSLVIREVQESDRALYTCRATNSYDSVDADATLQVHVPPRVVTRPSNVHARINGEVEFHCVITGVPKPAIHWRKDGNLLVASTYFQITDDKLTIMGLVSSDDGMYQCIGENAWGNVQAYAQLRMLADNTPAPTPLATTPTVDRTGEEPESSSTGGIPDQPRNLNMAIISTRFATVHWEVPLNTGTSSLPTYTVLWKERNSPRERVQNTTTLQFTLQNLTPGTRYLVKVYAHNSMGRSTSAAQMHFTTKEEAEVPSTVRQYTALPLSATTIRVRWEEPRRKNGEITKYMIYYYEEGQRSEQEVTTTQRSHEFTGLKSFRTYKFRIMAYNNNGAGPSTDEFETITYSSLPSAAPSNVSLQVTSSTSMLVQWAPPPVGDRNGIITGYQVRFKRRQSRRASRVKTDANIRTFDLNDLDPDTEYAVKVAALNVNGTGVLTPWVYATTHDSDLLENRVPDQPSSLTTRALVNSIIVSWTPPNDPTVRIRGYTLNWGIGHPHGNTRRIEATKRFYTINELEPSTNYVIMLKAFNDVGPGQPRLENTHTRSLSATPEPETPMLPPVYVKAIVVSDSSVTVTWFDNSLGAQQIVKDSRRYTVRYAQRGGRRYKYYNTTHLNAHLDNLRANTVYEFSVKVVKERRQSTWSMTVENTTFESAPQSAPRDVTPVSHGATIVQLNWQPPRNANGQVTENITGYVIIYTTDNTLDVQHWAVEAVLGNKLNKVIHSLTPDTTYYFKMNARNAKGYGPYSATVIYRTPRADGTGGGPIHTPSGTYNKPNGKPPKYNPEGTEDVGEGDASRANSSGNEGGDGGQGGISSNTMWIIIAVVAGVLVIAIIVFVGVMCRRHYSADSSKRQARNNGSNYKVGNSKNKPGKHGPKDINPPDLWIHHEQIEMKATDKPNHPDQMMSVAPMRRGSQEELKPLRDPDDPMVMDRRRNSFLKTRPLFHRDRAKADSAYSSHSSQDDDRYPRRHRAKPIMFPVDSQPLHPIATATAIPNGHILSDTQQSRSAYPRPPFTSANLYSATPRVQGAENSLPSSEAPSDDSLDRMGTIKRCPPQFAEPIRPQSPAEEKYCGSPASTLGSDKGPRPVHPLKSFSVPGPPSGSVPTTPTPKHIVKPQPPLMSPYRKASSSSSQGVPPSGAVQSKPPLPVVMPRAPDVTMQGKEEMEIQRANSTEELTAEMANLEGLMKDLNAITQNEFEC